MQTELSKTRAVYSVRQAAEALGVSHTAIIRRIEDGRIAASNYGTASRPWYKIKRDDLLAYIANSQAL